MARIARRTFLQSAVAACAARALAANPLGLPIGSQTYPHRQRIKDGDFPGLCKDLAALGVGVIELCSPGYGEFASLTGAAETRRIIEDHGLHCPSSHFSMRELRTGLDQSISWAHGIGMTQMGTASLNAPSPNGIASIDAVKRAADEYNRIAESTAKAGIQLFLHDERFEMSKVDGRLTYEVLLQQLDPNLVKMQFQMSAMTAVGDPIGYFTKYPGRFLSMHLQGVDLVPNQPPRIDLAVGSDSVDWPKVFAAAKTGGLKNYFIELSWNLTVDSVAYLKSLNTGG
jgi:sugar phosphate isomerase/epimerase